MKEKRMCEYCKHRSGNWCELFRCQTVENENFIYENENKVCFGYQEKQFENLFEFLESERRKVNHEGN